MKAVRAEGVSRVLIIRTQKKWRGDAFGPESKQRKNHLKSSFSIEAFSLFKKGWLWTEILSYRILIRPHDLKKFCRARLLKMMIFRECFGDIVLIHNHEARKID